MLIDGEIAVRQLVLADELAAMEEVDTAIDDNHGESGEDGRSEDLRPLGQFTQRIDGYEATDELRRDEFKGIFEREGTQQYSTNVCEKGGSRVHEDSDR